jgi:hypothetical protein
MRFRRMTPRPGETYTYLYCNGQRFSDKHCQQKGIRASLFEASFAFYLGAVVHALRLNLAASPSFAVPSESGGDLEQAQVSATAAKARVYEMADLIMDGSASRDDPRYQSALAEKEATEEAVRLLTTTAKSYRDELEQFVASVEQLVEALPSAITKTIDRETHTVSIKGQDIDLFGDRFVQKVAAEWTITDLATKRRIIERNFARIEVNSDTLAFGFATALPEPLALPALLDADDAAPAQAEGFGELDDLDAVPPRHTKRR